MIKMSDELRLVGFKYKGHIGYKDDIVVLFSVPGFYSI